jgi:hypothetical protein
VSDVSLLSPKAANAGVAEAATGATANKAAAAAPKILTFFFMWSFLL